VVEGVLPKTATATTTSQARQEQPTQATSPTPRPTIPEPEMVQVDGGTFWMGSSNKHQVTVSSFQMSKYEITQQQWTMIMGSNPSQTNIGNNYPVEFVSWEDIQTFLSKLNAVAGKNYRLPTEAEWEYAARGGNKSQGYTYSGSNTLNDVGWYSRNSNGGTHPVGQKLPNELGIYDMSGNVREWCSDWYGDYPSSPQTDPTGASSGSYRMIRGGSWEDGASRCLVADRYSDEPDNLHLILGFRVVESVLPKTATAATATTTPQATQLTSRPTIPEIEMVRVQGGTFDMGSNDGNGNERPVHRVSVSSFQIGKYEVTQAQWEAVMGSNPSLSNKGDNYPVENVSWDDVQTFLGKLNAATGKNYRLPTEAEWEYVARGGNKSQGYAYSGSNTLNDVGWYGNNSRGTHPVGQKLPNELGIYDMSGNVWEWCSDWYGTYPSSPQTDPMGASSGSYRVLRSGSWFNHASLGRVAIRSGDPPSHRFHNLGFRVVEGVLPKTETATTTPQARQEQPTQATSPPPRPTIPEPEMVQVDGGTFTMGSPASEAGRSSNEVQHQVTVSSFQIGKYEVTQGQWKAVMGDNPSSFTKGDNYPVENVSWDDVQEFHRKLNAATGKN
jgi:formylglycine-generating enzyme required for sulfatase activity